MSLFQSMSRTNHRTVGGYFLGGRTMTWWPVSSIYNWTNNLLCNVLLCLLTITAVKDCTVMVCKKQYSHYTYTNSTLTCAEKGRKHF